MTKKEALLKYTLRLADNASILGHRLGEWCGHGPVLEQDIAMTNIALDLIGQARNYYQYAAKLEAAGKTEDDYAYLRDPLDYYNLLLLEQPNGNFAHSIVRQYFFDIFHYLFLTALMSSKDKQLAAIAEKSIKEVTYHKKWSGDWILRLGDGTELSNEKMQTAINVLQTYVGELFLMDEVDEMMVKENIGVDLAPKRRMDQNRSRTFHRSKTKTTGCHLDTKRRKTGLP
ncbi:phenylacetate-CoA oxygenase subunit PaaC [Saprospiraceae bacterium]